MTAAQLAVLRSVRRGPVCYLVFGNAEWAAAVEMGKAGLLKWPEGRSEIEITATGLAALAAAEDEQKAA